MDTHPLITHQVARMRNEERVERGLAAYRALRLRDEQASDQSAVGASVRAGRLLDRLVRGKRAVERAARSAV